MPRLDADPSRAGGALYRRRHSLAHILAQAVLEVRPKAQLGFGPPVDTGFYYDFLLDRPLEEGELRDLERRMKKLLKRGQSFERMELDFDAAGALPAERGPPVHGGEPPAPPARQAEPR